VREHPGRLWLVAPKVDPADARVFGERLAAAVMQAASLHGAPLTISIGVAVCPDDGTAADALVAHADEGVFAARAAGVRLA
jgi:GGDEF domain-containing protein